MKINFDGAFDKHNARGGGGFIVRGAHSFYYHGLSVPIVELIGAGIKYAVFKSQVRKLWAEGDSLTVVCCLKNCGSCC